MKMYVDGVFFRRPHVYRLSLFLFLLFLLPLLFCIENVHSQIWQRQFDMLYVYLWPIRKALLWSAKFIGQTKQDVMIRKRLRELRKNGILIKKKCCEHIYNFEQQYQY